MAFHLTWGFDIARIGDLSVEVRDAASANPFEVTIATSGRYAYYDISGVSGVDHADFATALAARFNAEKTGAYGSTFTVTTATAGSGVGGPGYQIQYNAGATAFELDFTAATTPADGVRLRRVLGFSSGGGVPSGTFISDVRPYYVIVPQIAGRARFDDEYEPDGSAAVEAVADSGASYSLSPTTVETRQDWQHWFEAAKAAVFERAAPDGTTPGDVPWTWQHAWKHARAIEPFVATDGSDQSVHKMRAKGAAFDKQARRQVHADLDTLWHISMRTRLLGRL